jgi:hypothetical protein
MQKPVEPHAVNLAKSLATSLIVLVVVVIFALLGTAAAQPAPSASPPPDAAPAVTASPPDTATPPPAPAKEPAASHAHAARVPDKSGPAKFPSAIAANYAKDPAGKARRETCLEQYKANKSTGENGGLKWIQKGGGYFSVCSRKLKS